MNETADLIVNAWRIATVNRTGDILNDSAIAIKDGRICAIGRQEEIWRRFPNAPQIGGARFVLTPGMVNTHIHITGETLFRSYIPDTSSFDNHVFHWLMPLLSARVPGDDAIAARLTAVEMLRNGTTTFLEAGSSQYLEETVEALSETGIRGRIGNWIWDIPGEPDCYKHTTHQAIKRLRDQLESYPDTDDCRLSAWALLVGHSTASDHLWREAAALTSEFNVGMAFHMSPVHSDTKDYIRTFGKAPLSHLNEIGVLDCNPVITHLVHINDEEMEILAESGAHVSHCPTSALRCAYGVTQVGRFPEMAARGVNVTIGTDAANASNHNDIMRAAHLVAGLYKDARQDMALFPSTQVLEMVTMGGAKALKLDKEIGSIEIGKRADLVLHDTDRPEWRPMLDVVNQLIWSADGRGVHTVLIDGEIVVEDGRCVTIDEEKLWHEAQQAGEQIVMRFENARR